MMYRIKFEKTDIPLGESVKKIWPEGSMFTHNDGIWQITGNDGEYYDLIHYCNNGIRINWKLSMEGFPPKGIGIYKNGDYNGEDT